MIERIQEVERACFSALVLAAIGGMGSSATTAFRKLPSMLVECICSGSVFFFPLNMHCYLTFFLLA